jgi:DNA repair exonuclease SbcCD ATPase subunit
MKIKKVEWRNFFSYGNKKQELVFEKPHSLIQCSGANAAGKSSISHVIVFVLYGKVEGKKLKDIPNRINGNAWARIEISTKHGEVAIERGLEPNIFRLFVNGIEYDQAGKKSIQEYITDDILGIPYYVFNNTILLSINDFKSFIKMGVADKRAIIDRIFGFEVLNTMREILREEIRRIKSSYDTLDGQLQSTMRSLEASISEMESAAIAIDGESQDRIQGWETEMQKFEALKTLHTQKIEEFKTSESELVKAVASSNAAVMSLELNIKNQKSKLKLYENDQCPTCHSTLSGEFHESAKSALEESIADLEKDLESAQANAQELDSKYVEMNSFKLDLIQKGERIKSKIQSISESIRAEKGKSVKTELASLQKLVESLESDKDRIEGEKIKTGERGIWLKTLDEILGERGVKQLAIKSVLPTLNSQIQDLLIEMGIPYRVQFDEEFNAVLTHMGMEISVTTLSTGEMKKVDFSVLMAIVRLMKIKFSGLNLLFLDEIFSSVDGEGIGAILKILRQNSEDLGLNVFVINHAPMPLEIFDSHLEIRKANNFSEIHLDS